MIKQPAGVIRIGPKAIKATIEQILASIQGIAAVATGPQAIQFQETATGLTVSVGIWVQTGSAIEHVAEQARKQLSSQLEATLGQPVANIAIFVYGIREIRA